MGFDRGLTGANKIEVVGVNDKNKSMTLNCGFDRGSTEANAKEVVIVDVDGKNPLS